MRHLGVVKSISDGVMTVQMVSAEESCAGCAVASMCNARSETQVQMPAREDIHPGDTIEFEIGATKRYRSISMLLAVPTAVFIVALVVGLQFTGDEGVSAAIAVGVTAAWYAALYILSRNRKVDYKIIGIKDLGNKECQS